MSNGLDINPSRVFATLEAMEQDFIESEADALGISVDAMVMELIREGLALVASGEIDMDEVFQNTDRQWKSH